MELTMEHFVRNWLVKLRMSLPTKKTNKIASYCSFFNVAYLKQLVTISTTDSTEDKLFFSISDATHN